LPMSAPHVTRGGATSAAVFESTSAVRSTLLRVVFPPSGREVWLLGADCVIEGLGVALWRAGGPHRGKGISR
jgi:hypothetical protein